MTPKSLGVIGMNILDQLLYYNISFEAPEKIHGLLWFGGSFQSKGRFTPQATTQAPAIFFCCGIGGGTLGTFRFP